MKSGEFRFFKVPQPLQKGQGVMLSVCDISTPSANSDTSQEYKETDRRRLSKFAQVTAPHAGAGSMYGGDWRRLDSINMAGQCCKGNGCSDPDIYVSSELPR